MSFCRITGKSRGLPKPNYFPLLPPISPADAKRLCRITNKSQGQPTHHYIPALSSAKISRTFCKVTGKSEGQGPHHYPNAEGNFKEHIFIPDYKYVFPKFDEDQKHQKTLLALLSSKCGVECSNVRYVYSVDEKKTNLVIPAGLEAAVRDGEVRDVMLGQEGDTILIKMYQGPNVTVDVDNFILEEGTILWEGMGPSEAVLLRNANEEKENSERKAKRVKNIKDRKKIFEDKEKIYEDEELEVANRQEIRRAKMKERNSMKKNLNEFVHFKEKLLSDPDNSEPIFGHIVHSSGSVAFYPGTSVIDLPEGKIIPGRMERHKDGVKFVPGMMVEEKFVPGQMVVTNNGEEFVPGQVIETSEGPKFVPGQVANTISGPKFVPGQTMLTENGYQFVPGQIIETKAGPTFIPGQIIVTDDEAKFVPGRVVETSEGPRFVPGRVIEAGDQVTFVSGQVVETPEGLKFVAPDLENAMDGVQEFSVQGFEVTPEELKLLHPATCRASSDAMVSIDSEVLRQLSKAGMSIGRQMSSELPKVDVRLLPVTSDRLKLTGEHAVQLTQVVLSLAQVALRVNRLDESCTSNIEVKESDKDLMRTIEKGKNLEKYLRIIVASAVVSCRQSHSVTEEALMIAVSLAMESTLGEAALEVSPENIIQTLYGFLRLPENLNQIVIETMNYLEANETLKDKISFATNKAAEPAKIIKKISKGLNGSMEKAFAELFSKDPSLFEEFVEQLNRFAGRSDTPSDQQLEEIIENAIVSTVRERSSQKLKELLEETGTKGQAEVKEFQNLLHQSVGLAKALGMRTVANTLMEVISNPKTHKVLCSDATVMSVLQRLTVMRQIAEAKPEFAEALGKLIEDPEEAKSDPDMRELLRRSTALMVAPNKNLESSSDIPISLLMSCNSLAIENYLAETKRPKILLIIKSGLQAVVPREAARAVLTGKVPYAVVDEKGIKYFEPLHVFSAMKFPKYAARCFKMYCCPEVDHRVGDAFSNGDGVLRGGTEFKLLKTSNKF